MTREIDDSDLKRLKTLATPEPDARARSAALNAAMNAYDRQYGTAESGTSQGKSLGARLRSIFNVSIGDWTMDLRIPIGVAATGLLLVPLSMQLLNTTSLAPTGPAPLPPMPLEQPLTSPSSGEGEAVALRDEVRQRSMNPGTLDMEKSEADDGFAVAEESMPMGNVAAQGETFASGPAAGSAGRVQPQSLAANTSVDGDRMMKPSPMLAPERTHGYENPQGDVFTGFETSPVKSVARDPVSTFSIDVDTASYSYVRRSLEAGMLPPPDAVRVEEMINYFTYDYAAPQDASAPFAPTVAVYPSPWREGANLMHVGIKGFAPEFTERAPANIVLLIDTSGSMNEPDKLPLLKRAMGVLVDELRPEDSVAIVTYAGSAGVVLDPTSASAKAKILSALDRLGAGGSTAGAEGIELAYDLAAEAAREGGQNRVILATDGDFNVGISDPEALTDFIADKRNEGIFLSVLGFGTGNYQDATMQALAQNGNGTAAYIDSFREARKVLSEEVGGTLETIASDVKIQVEFNPSLVSEYRLVGYETRALAREDFNNDRVDAGEIGAGHTVTAIYEIVPVGSPAISVDPLRYGSGEEIAPIRNPAGEEYGFLKMRYKLPGEETSRLIERPVGHSDFVDSFDRLPDDLRFAAAVAAFGQKLRDGDLVHGLSFGDIAEIARNARAEDSGGYRAEFVTLAEAASSLTRD